MTHKNRSGHKRDRKIKSRLRATESKEGTAGTQEPPTILVKMIYASKCPKMLVLFGNLFMNSFLTILKSSLSTASL